MWKEVNSAVTKFMKNEVIVTSDNPVLQDIDTVCNMLTASIIQELAKAQNKPSNNSNSAKKQAPKPKQEQRQPEKNNKPDQKK